MSVFLFFTCLYTFSIGRGFYSSDGEVMFKTTAALVERHTFALEADPGLPQIVEGQGSHFYSKYDPGLSLLLAPSYVIGDWIAGINHAHRYRVAATLALVVPALAGAGALAALASLINKGGFRNPPLQTGWLVVGAAGLASPLWYYARVLFAESALACALTLAVLVICSTGCISRDVLQYASTRIRPGALLLAGVMFGVGILTRAALVIYLPALVWLIVRQQKNGTRMNADKRGLKSVFPVSLFLIGLLPFVAALVWHNDLRFGDPMQFGYTREGFTTPVGEGVLGLLFSPGKSVFFYAPPLVLSAILWSRFRRAYPALGEFLALAWAAALIFYGAWWAWHGGWCWGPRFLVPLMPLSALPLIMLPDGQRWRLIAAALILIGIAVQGAGVLTDLTPHYAALTQGDQTDYAALHTDLRQTPQVAAFRYVAQGQTEPLAMFHLGDTGLPPTWTLGAPALLLIGIMLGAWQLLRATFVKWS